MCKFLFFFCLAVAAAANLAVQVRQRAIQRALADLYPAKAGANGQVAQPLTVAVTLTVKATCALFATRRSNGALVAIGRELITAEIENGCIQAC